MSDHDSVIALCVITPIYNDFKAFQITLESMRGELLASDQLVVIDSSDDHALTLSLIDKSGLACEICVLWTPPTGVYGALNTGIQVSKRPWLQIVNSGDMLLPGARNAISQVIEKDRDIDVHVFCQQAGSSRGEGYVFIPDSASLWPHQSVVMHSRVHKILGYYDLNYRLTADQIFLASVRKSFSWKIHDFTLTYYDLNGMSSAVNMRNSSELWEMWLALGRNPFQASWLAWFKPWLRKSLEFLFGHYLMLSLRRALTPSYHKLKTKREK